MKKMMIPLLALALSLASCSKDSDSNCYWTDNAGGDWDHYPTASERKQFEQNCSCEMVLTKYCD